MKDDALINLVAQWRCGDQGAANELFHRYAEQLIALARSRLSAKVSTRVDAEDVVQSAYRSFFCGTRDGRFDVQRGGDLWRLLVVLMLNKLQHQVRRNRAAKRSVDRETPLGAVAETRFLPVGALTHEPSPIEAVALADELELLMGTLGPLQRRMLQLRLQGHNLEEIGVQTQRTERTVRRVLEGVKQHLEQRLATGVDS